MAERYENDLWKEPAEIVGVAREGVVCGLAEKRVEPGFTLTDGTVLLESEKDGNGFYIGGAGMDGMYLSTLERYEPVRDDAGQITGFQKLSRYTLGFTSEELGLIYSYGLNTKENLLEDLDMAQRAARKAPWLQKQFSGLAEKLKRIPPDECRRLMVDVYAVYKRRHIQELGSRQQAAARQSMQAQLTIAQREAAMFNATHQPAKFAVQQPEH